MPNNNLKLILPAVIFLVVGVVIGFLVGGAVSKGGVKSILPSTGSTNTSSTASLFTSQTALIQGKITRVNGKILTVQSSKNNQVGDFETADRIFINKTTATGTPASPSSDLKSIELNKDAIINLEYTNGKYRVVSVSYLPNIQPNLPVKPGSTPPLPASAPALPR